MKWGNCVITKKDKDASGKYVLEGELKLDDKDFKKTKKLTWITNSENVFEFTLVELDHIITKKKVEDDESVKDIVNYNSRIAYTAIAEGPMKQLQPG